MSSLTTASPSRSIGYAFSITPGRKRAAGWSRSGPVTQVNRLAIQRLSCMQPSVLPIRPSTQETSLIGCVYGWEVSFGEESLVAGFLLSSMTVGRQSATGDSTDAQSDRQEGCYVSHHNGLSFPQARRPLPVGERSVVPSKLGRPPCTRHPVAFGDCLIEIDAKSRHVRGPGVTVLP